jgi:hypothetical protein
MAFGSDNFNMNLLVTLLLTATMTAHAGLGCCIHLGECTAASNVGLHHDEHEHCRNHSDGHQAPEKCEKQCCVFVASRPAAQWSIDLTGIVLPIQAPLSHAPMASSAAMARLIPEITLHPTGPALHVWQCLWVI